MKPYPPSLFVHVASLILIAATTLAAAETVTLTPVADTSLFSNAPGNNAGGNLSLATGNTAGAAPLRALLRFDPASVIPPGTRITGVNLRLQVVRAPLGAAPTTFDLHRVFVGWGEGSGGSGSGIGIGSPANPDEATWNSRFHPAFPWSSAGGEANADFAGTASGSTENISSEPLNFESTAELVADVQAWVNTPAANFGWLIKDRFEGVGSTARRLASREDASRAPALTIEYVRETLLSVTVALDSNGSVCLRFTAKPGKTYKLQRREQIDSGDWTTIATREPDDVGGETSLCDPLNTTALARFYRVSEE